VTAPDAELEVPETPKAERPRKAKATAGTQVEEDLPF